MSQGNGVVSSAVIIPDFPEPDLSNSPPPKRRQSSTSESGSKRLKLSRDRDVSPSESQLSPPAQAERETTDSADQKRDAVAERRTSSKLEERKRGQRLFGGLLSTLSQSTPNGQQKRRSEIEKRQAERVEKQKVQDEARRVETLAKLKKTRKVEQVKFNEQSMRIRHSNMLATANFLQTKTAPKLYYKPWELKPAESDRIKTQIAETEAQIAREIEDFQYRHPEQIQERKWTDSRSEQTTGEPQFESPSVSNAPDVDVDATNLPVPNPQSAQATAERESLEEHSGEILVEADEDTVIY